MSAGRHVRLGLVARHSHRNGHRQPRSHAPVCEGDRGEVRGRLGQGQDHRRRLLRRESDALHLPTRLQYQHQGPNAEHDLKYSV